MFRGVLLKHSSWRSLCVIDLYEQAVRVPAVDCGVPPNLPGATVAYDDGTVFRSVAVYTCNSRLVLAGVAGETTVSARCMRNGRWSSVDVNCIGTVLDVAYVFVQRRLIVCHR